MPRPGRANERGVELDESLGRNIALCTKSNALAISVF